MNQTENEVLISAVGAVSEAIPPERDLELGEFAPRAGAVQLTPETTLACCARLTARGLRTLALNFADAHTPGGLYLSGALAQEETCCRQTTLWTRLTEDGVSEYYAANAALGGMEFTNWAILSRNVAVFRDDVYDLLERPFYVDFLTIPAPMMDVTATSDGEAMRGRIERLLEIAAWSGAEAIVLGAFGCGAFGNDPARTARIFRESLLAHNIQQRFEVVAFPVFDFGGKCWKGFEAVFGGVAANVAE